MAKVTRKVAKEAYDWGKAKLNEQERALKAVRTHMSDANTVAELRAALGEMKNVDARLQSLANIVKSQFGGRNYKEYKREFAALGKEIQNKRDTIANVLRQGGPFDKKLIRLQREEQAQSVAKQATPSDKTAVIRDEARGGAPPAAKVSDVNIAMRNIPPSRRAAVAGKVLRAIARIAALEKEESQTFNTAVKGPLVGMHKALNNFVANEFNPRVGAIYTQLKLYDAQDQAAESNMQELVRESGEIAETTEALIDLLEQVQSIAQKMKVSPQERAKDVAKQLNLSQFAQGFADDVQMLNKKLAESTKNYTDFLHLRETSAATIRERETLLERVGNHVIELRQAFAKLEQQFNLGQIESSIGKLENELEDQRKGLDAFVQDLKKRLEELTARVQQASKARQA